MTSAVLRVTPVGLRELAQRCAALAGAVAPALAAVSASAGNPAARRRAPSMPAGAHANQRQ